MGKISRQALSKISDQDLLALKMNQLPLTVKGTQIERYLGKLYWELQEKGLSFFPDVYPSDEWFSPDAIPAIAVPFYLLHPRLIRLEKKMMLEAEGSTEVECMKILRHEAAHVIDTAFRLHFRRDWQRVFGSFAKKYPKYYAPKPGSRDFVVHLNGWYAQAHPAEDFAETFAVWLSPRSRWKAHYKGWPALQKLEFVDQLMKEIAGESPKNTKKGTLDPLNKLNITLEKHYQKKQAFYRSTKLSFFDNDLMKMFSSEEKYKRYPSAARFILDQRKVAAEQVASWTGVPTYSVAQLIDDMVDRSKQLKLRLMQSEKRTNKDLILILSIVAMRFVYRGRLRVAL